MPTAALTFCFVVNKRDVQLILKTPLPFLSPKRLRHTHIFVNLIYVET